MSDSGRPGALGDRRVRVAITIVGLAVATGLALAARSMRPRAPLPVYGEVPAFALVDSRGAPFTDKTMRGHVNLVDFIFTRCPSSCPRLTARMGTLQAKLAGTGDDVRLVSFSVDPENDTPPVLADYAAHAHADPARWTFVTGPINDIQATAVLGFKVSAARIAKDAGDYDVVHGDWFVLVDRAMRLRGYYSTEQESDLDPIVDDARRLAHEKP
jgi:protein SCO1/2